MTIKILRASLARHLLNWGQVRIRERFPFRLDTTPVGLSGAKRQLLPRLNEPPLLKRSPGRLLGMVHRRLMLLPIVMDTFSAFSAQGRKNTTLLRATSRCRFCRLVRLAL